MYHDPTPQKRKTQVIQMNMKTLLHLTDNNKDMSLAIVPEFGPSEIGGTERKKNYTSFIPRHPVVVLPTLPLGDIN